MQITSIQNLNSGPFLGDSNIEQKAIDQAVNYLIQLVSQPYFNLIKQIFKDIRNGRYDPIKKIQLESSEGQLGGYLRIPEYLTRKYEKSNCEHLKSEEALILDNIRCFAEIYYELIDLEQNNPINHLLILLSQKIKNLGFPSKLATIRFEKGCFDSQVQIWHRDTNAFNERVYTISTNYSTISDWSTRILDEEMTKQIFGDLSKIPSGILNDSEMIEKAESLSSATRLGFLYNVSEILHRAPRKTDLSPDLININDYRLFIRFVSK